MLIDPVAAATPAPIAVGWRSRLRPARYRIRPVPIIVTGLLGLVAVVPVVTLLVDTFTENARGLAMPASFTNWTDVLSNEHVWRALLNTVLLTVATEAVAIPLGVGITWLMTRTNVAPRRLIGGLLWVAFFLPALPVINGWILLADPSYGLLNSVLGGAGDGPLNIYSFWGIVWIHLVTKSISAKYILLAPTLSQMDVTLEESSRMCGASPWQTLRRVSLPVMMPAIVMTAVLSAIYSVESFEIEMMLGTPADIDVYSTRIYGLTHESPPQLAQAKVLGICVLLLMAPLIVLYQRYARRNTVAFQSSRARVERRSLRPMARAVWSSALLTFCFVCTVVPLVLLVVGTFMTFFGFFDVADPWTTTHWTTIFENPDLRNAAITTLQLGLGAAIAGTMLYAVVAFVIVRSQSRLAGTADFLSWLPVALPGLIFGLGLLAVVIQTPALRTFYGTTWVLIVAVVVASMTTGVQLLKTNLAQQHPELEEASAMCGAGRARTLARITLRILSPALVTVAVVSFAAATSNVAHVVMLSSGSTQPLSTLQLQYLSTGRYETAAVVGTITVAISLSFALAAHLISARWQHSNELS